MNKHTKLSLAAYGLWLAFFSLWHVGEAQMPIRFDEAANYLQFFEVKGSEKALPKYQGLWFALDKRSNAWLLYGQTGKEEVIFLERIKQPLTCSPDQFASLRMEGGRLDLCCTTPGKMEIRCATFLWEREHPVFQNEERYDPAKAMMRRAEQDLNAGALAMVALRLDSIVPAEAYYDRKAWGGRMIQKALEMASELEKRRKFEEAAALLIPALEFSFLSLLEEWKSPQKIAAALGKSWQGIDAEVLSASGAKVAVWFAEERKYEQAEFWANRWKPWFPNQPMTYYALAEVAYGKRQREVYPGLYQRYLDLMKAAGKEKEIDVVAAQRARR